MEPGACEERLWITSSLFDARDHLAPVLRDGDVVLYENDLEQHAEGGTRMPEGGVAACFRGGDAVPSGALVPANDRAPP